MDVMCPHCNELYYDLDDELLGRPAECENCGKEFTIRDAAKASLDSPPIAKLHTGPADTPVAPSAAAAPAASPPKTMPVPRPIPTQPGPAIPVAGPAVPVAAPVGTEGDTMACPFCGETIKRQARLCRFCHSDLTAGSASSPALAGPGAAAGVKRDFGLPLLLIPAVATFLAFFWISSLNLLQSPGEKLTLIAIATVASTATLAAMEMSRRPENPETKGDSPIALAIGMLFLWIFVYPYYMARRKKYGLRYLGGYALLIAIAFAAVLFWLMGAIETQKDKVRKIFGQHEPVREERVVAESPRHLTPDRPARQA